MSSALKMSLMRFFSKPIYTNNHLTTDHMCKLPYVLSAVQMSVRHVLEDVFEARCACA